MFGCTYTLEGKVFAAGAMLGILLGSLTHFALMIYADALLDLDALRSFPLLVRSVVFLGYLLIAASFVYGAIVFRTRPMFRRDDDTLRCTRCRYPVQPEFPRCPECGRSLDNGGAARGGPGGKVGPAGAAGYMVFALFVVAVGLRIAFPEMW